MGTHGLCYHCTSQGKLLLSYMLQILSTPSLIHHQNATCGVSCGTCGVSCGSIPLRRMPNTTPGAAALLPCIWHPAGDQEIGGIKCKSTSYKIGRWIWDPQPECHLRRWFQSHHLGLHAYTPSRTANVPALTSPARYREPAIQTASFFFAWETAWENA